VVTCPDGHESAAADYCDVCGMRLGPPVALVTQRGAGTGGGAGGPEAGAAPSRSAPPCPRCGSPGLERFCEACGYQVGSASAPTRIPAPSPDRSSAWTALVTASRPYFDAVMAARGPDSGSAQFPAYCPERRFQLTWPQMRIGRQSVSRGITPEIDLSGPPADPGISRLHAILLARPDGSWAVADPGSENGTKVNDVEIATDVPVPLADGDCIFLGAWTAITIAQDKGGLTSS
jgi:FHA domain